MLSAFIGAQGPGFLGGPEVQLLEREAAERFGVRHVVAVNSWTSGLVAAVGAIGISPGDEVVVTLDDGGHSYRDSPLEWNTCVCGH